MRRILFAINSAYLPRDRGGANISLHALCMRLAARGFEPLVACGTDAVAGPSEAEPRDDMPYRLLRFAKPAQSLGGVVDRFAPLATVVRAPASAESQAHHAAIERVVHVYFESGFIHRNYPAPRAAPNFRYAANSPFLARLAESYFAMPVPMIPPVIEPEAYRVERTGDAVLFVNPVGIKGVHIAAAVAARLPHRHFLFARSWPDTVQHPHVAVTLPNVEWLAPMDDMRPAFTRTRLLLVPSVWEESSARIIGEAQISGIPAIASDRGGLRESVGPGGLVLPLGEPIDAWCDAVETLFTDAARYASLSAGALNHAARRDYLPEAAVTGLLDFVGA